MSKTVAKTAPKRRSSVDPRLREAARLALERKDLRRRRAAVNLKIGRAQDKLDSLLEERRDIAEGLAHNRADCVRLIEHGFMMSFDREWGGGWDGVRAGTDPSF